MILVAGNHDIYFERTSIQKRPTKKITYLRNAIYEDDNIVVYGTPECHLFGNWAFMKEDEIQEKIHSKFNGFNKDGKLHIILSHDAPYGYSDVCLEYFDTKQHRGNHVLTNLIKRTKPDWFIHGHLHSSNHNIEVLGNTNIVNVSLSDERYKISYCPYYLNLENENSKKQK